MFYRDILGFTPRYQRPEEGFAYLVWGEAELMIDQIGLGRDLAAAEGMLGRGLNIQIRVPSVEPLLAALAQAGLPLHTPLEQRWYRRRDVEIGQCQFVVADPDGYLLRFFEHLGERSAINKD